MAEGDEQSDPEPLWPGARGRAARCNPPGQFERVHLELDPQAFADDPELLDALRRVPTEYLVDDARTLVSHNDSPDIPFRYSVNPYRGCSHGCAYCYARPTHEYYGLSAGLDFESKVFVKLRSPQLLREWLSRSAWQPQPIAFSGVTDCYQPAERCFRLTRGCLEVACQARQPVMICTKNRLVTRDLDLLREMAGCGAVRVALSITTLDPALARSLEPRTSEPAARLQAVAELAAAGVPTGVMVAPVIPGLTDHEIPAILAEARRAGAQWAAYTLLRLPEPVQPVFVSWLAANRPDQAQRVTHRIRATRAGQWTDDRFGCRHTGEGCLSEQIAQLFRVFAAREGLDQPAARLSADAFRRPAGSPGQRWLF